MPCDARVDAALQEQGCGTIRFLEKEVLKNTDDCIEKIIL